MTIDIKEKFTNRDDFTVKFADAPFTDGAINPGWAEPTTDEFLTKMADVPVLLNQSAIIPMNDLVMDLDFLDADVEMESQRNLSTGNTYTFADIRETTPDKTRKQLIARPLAVKTIITDNFLNENIEKEDFLSKWLTLLTDRTGGAYEKTMVFADTASTETVPSGYKVTDGLVKQCTALHNTDTNHELGCAKLVYKNNLATGVIDAVQRYIDNDGDLNNATMVVPPQMYSRLVSEIANDRETNWGDMVYQDGNITKILGVELKQDNLLRKTKNGWDTQYFKDGEHKTASGGGASSVDKLLYGFIGQPNNTVFGMFEDIQVKQQWDIDVFGYKAAVLCSGDVKTLHDEDTLLVPFTMNDFSS